MSRFVIVVDTQQDFMQPKGALYVAGAQTLVPLMQDWLDGLLPDETAGVLFTYDTHLPAVYEQSEEAKAFPPHCELGTPGWDNMLDTDGISPDIPVYKLEKGVFDMWAQPDLLIEDIRLLEAPGQDRDAFFQRLAAGGTKRVVVIGVAADFCVRWAVEGLLARGFEVEILANLTKGIERQIDQVVAEEFAGKTVSLIN